VLAAGEQSVSSPSASSDPSAAPPGGSSRSKLQVDQRDKVLGPACTPSCCYCTHQCGCSTVHSTALRASMCCDGVHDAYAVCMEDTIALICDRMRVAADEVWLVRGVIGSHLDRPHCNVLWICSVYCIAGWQHTVDARSPVWLRGCGASSAGCRC